MKFRLLLVSVFWLLGLFGCSAHSQKDDELKSLGHIGLAPLPVTEVQFYSESLQRNMYMNVILPRGYKESEVRYPVLYLCHGLTSNYHEFEYVGVPEYLNCFDMIVIMVDAGNSWYVNWQNPMITSIIILPIIYVKM